ncbi:hypothetical protein ACFWY6_41345 [Streptomyces sp. NPDC059037]|uniref:hypothetical protein n=1 Tax=Streptomyces sp. NPDC059037 TaxID=3346710 RepID=UPI0036C09D68
MAGSARVPRSARAGICLCCSRWLPKRPPARGGRRSACRSWGALAAADAGLELTAGLVIDEPGRTWTQVLAVLLETVPVVLVGPLGQAPSDAVRGLAAIMRRSGSVLLSATSWPGAEVRLTVERARWEGVSEGHGLLRGRRVTVTSSGRGAAAASRSADLWLPGPNGAVTFAQASAPEAADADRAGSAPGLDSVVPRRPALRVVG